MSRILGSLNRFFSAPVFDDEQTARRAGLLSFLINLHILIALSVALIFAFIAHEPLILSASALISILPALGARLFLARGHVTIASLIFMAMIAMLMPLIAWFSENSVSSASVTAFQAVTIVMFGLLLGGWAALGFSLFTVAANTFLIYAETHGLYTVTQTITYRTVLLSQAITFVAIVAILWLTNRLIRESFLRARRAAQERQIAEHGLNLALQAANLGAWRYDVHSGKAYISDRFIEMIGGKESPQNLGFIHPDDFQAVQQALRELISGQLDSASLTHRILQPDGSLCWVESWGMLERDEKNQPSMLSGLSMDITERMLLHEQTRRMNVELEKRVAERTAQLETTNRELESFSYSVSHDLRAPLRTINGYTRILQEDYAGHLDPQAVGYLDNINQSVQRMNGLIEALSRLSGLTQAQLTRTRVDLTRLAQEITASLCQGQPDRQVEFRIQPGLAVQGDPNLLRIVLENLLGNAWKFTRLQPQACVELGAMDQVGQTIYFVRDNGVGFDMAYADRLFAAFQRLHREEEFEGTGIGLATVQRIIHRHGGRIWAEAEPGKGAVFYFTLPGS